MTKVHLQPKEKPRAKVTLAACEKLAKRVHPGARVEVCPQTRSGVWITADDDIYGSFASAEHKSKAVALRALHAALTVLAEGK